MDRLLEIRSIAKDAAASQDGSKAIQALMRALKIAVVEIIELRRELAMREAKTGCYKSGGAGWLSLLRKSRTP